jgi:cbb3-type cytochrome oxidase maturation protein
VETIFVLLPLALLIAAIAVGFFVWAARTGQFDDLDTPAVRILFDDEEPAFASSAMALAASDEATAGRPAPAVSAPARPADTATVRQAAPVDKASTD